ncbi:unnamed protein product, partial [Ectocarpus sp. 8 AP-2014]
LVFVPAPGTTITRGYTQPYLFKRSLCTSTPYKARARIRSEGRLSNPVLSFVYKRQHHLCVQQIAGLEARHTIAALPQDMPLTRKQAWRRVRVVRHEVGSGETKDDEAAAAAAAAACAKRPASDWIRQMTQRPQQQQQREPSPPPRTPAARTERSDSSDSATRSPERERDALDNWRLPKEGRHPSARPGASAAKRQAAAACVRVGSRVSFNTVVAAILIPSAKDLHAAARQELWWQETDYRDFRINFIQFMRTPPAAAAGEGPELVPVEIVAESKSSQDEEEGKVMQDDEEVQQPVVVDAAVYEDARATEKVRAWPVQSEPELALPPPGLVAKQSSASLSDSDTSPPTPPSEPGTLTPSSDGGESDESVETAADISCCHEAGLPPVSPEPLLPSSTYEEQSVTSSSSTTTTSAPAADIAQGRWQDDEEVERAGSSVQHGGSSPSCSLGWSSPDEGNTADEDGEGDGEEDEEEDEEGNTIRVRRAFSNLETARRGGGGGSSGSGSGLSALVSGDDSSDGGDSSDSSDGGEGSGRHHDRPRALSLDGWFTCGLENGVNAKSYETHDHAGRLRDLVKLAPLPAVCPTPPLMDANANQEVDLNDALRRLGVTFNVSVKGGDGVARRRQSLDDVGAGGDNGGETKCRAEGDCDDDDVARGFSPSAAAAAANRGMVWVVRNEELCVSSSGCVVLGPDR